MVDNSCSACANPTNEYKKGGKVKKGKKGVSQSVLCDRCSRRALNATVLLRKGNAPRRRSNPGVAKRLLSQGSAFGGGLPGPLNASSYGSAPQVAQPLGRMDFINSGESSYYYNRRRDHRDDFQPPANPSGIRADVKPSIRAVSSSSAVASPDTGLELSRLRGSYDALSPEYQRIYNNLAFQGEVPRLNDPNLQPSMRASASRPTAGQLASSSSSSYRESYGGSEELFRYKPTEYIPPPMSLAGASAVPSSSASRNQPGRERPFTTTLSRRPQAERERYDEEQLYGPTKKKRDPPLNPVSLRRGGSVF
jgi:hypothetical protein